MRTPKIWPDGAQGECSVASAHFEKAIATFRQYCLPWEEADTLQYWGRALLATGERAPAIEKFDAAIEIYRSRGASARFIEYVMADKKRAQDSTCSCSEVAPALTDLTHAVAKGITQEPTDPITHAAPDGSSSKKVRPR